MVPSLLEGVRNLSESDLSAMVRRHRIDLDKAKRLDVPTQVARALAFRPELRHLERLSPAARALIERLVLEGGLLKRKEAPPVVDELQESDLVLVKAGGAGVTLSMPVAYLLQIPRVPGEDPTCLRALLSEMAEADQRMIASHYAGRPVVGPANLALEGAWRVLGSERALQREIDALHPSERDLLMGIEELGGEVDTHELLDLEREPIRMVSGQPRVRRGPSYSLERRGFVVTPSPARHLIPREVRRVVGAHRAKARRQVRAQVRAALHGADHAPLRAAFAEPPWRVVTALALLAHGGAGAGKRGVGTPLTVVRQSAKRLGQSVEKTHFLCALSRELGLWDENALEPLAAPGLFRTGELDLQLFNCWLRSAAWDESRPEPEVARAPVDARIAGPTGLVRELVLEAVAELVPGEWVPWGAVLDYIRADERAQGVQRLLSRWARRVGVELPGVGQVARKIAFESLHWLSLVDVGPPGGGDGQGRDRVLRVKPSGRELLERGSGPLRHSKASDSPLGGCTFRDTLVDVGDQARLADVLQVAKWVEVGRVLEKLELAITPGRLTASLADGDDPRHVIEQLGKLAPVPEVVEETVQTALNPRAHLVLSQSGGFLWVEDADILEQLQSGTMRELFYEKSPPGGLLLAAGVDVPRVERRCRALGLVLRIDEKGAVSRG